METRIPFLEQLEADLEALAEEVAAAQQVLPGPSAPRRRRPAHSRWKAWSGAAAALLVLAWGIGSLGGASMEIPASAPADGATHAADVPQALDPETPDRLGIDERSAFGAAPRAAPADAYTVGDGNDLAWVGQHASKRSTSATDVDIAKIDRDGSLTLKLEEGQFKGAFQDVVAIAQANGGVLMASQTTGTDSGILTLRIPADNFDRAFASVSRLGAVRASNVVGKDVTARYLDQQAHLRIAKTRRTFLFGLFDQANTIPQSIHLYDELERVQLRIDEIQGQLNYLNAQTSISTLTVTLSEREPEPAAQQRDPGVENPSLSRAWDRAVQGFLGVIATVIVGLGYLVPVGILAALGLLIFMLARRRGPGAS